MDKTLIEIPKEYNTNEKKLDYIDKLCLIQQKLYNMDTAHSFRLHLTKKYYEEKLKNSL